MRLIKPKLQTIIEYLILLAVAVCFLLLFSLWTTPLLPKWYGCDASFFSMAGRGILEGWVPYRDFFDLKGPYFFFLQALGQLMHRGRFGIFLLQVPFLFASLVLIYKMSQLYLSKKKSAFIICVFLFLHIAMLWGGNTLEEFCLPINLLCMYLSFKTIKEKNHQRLPRYAFIYGICFGLILFSKITVAAPLVGIVLTFAVLLLIKRKYRDFFRYVLFFLGGLAAASLPLLLYFGWNGTLLEMFYAVFAFGFRRSVDFAEAYNLTWELKAFGCVFALLFALFHKKELQTEARLLLILSASITYLALHFGTPFVYYFTTTIPILVAAMILFMEVYNPLIIDKSVKQVICVVAFAVLLFYYENQSTDTIRTTFQDRNNPYYDEYYQNAVDLATFIPKQEQQDVYCFNIDMQWFEINDMLPCYKYPINTPFFADLDSNIKENLVDFMKQTPPKWVIASNSIHDEMNYIGEVLDEKYQPIYSNDLGELYLLVE